MTTTYFCILTFQLKPEDPETKITFRIHVNVDPTFFASFIKQPDPQWNFYQQQATDAATILIVELPRDKKGEAPKACLSIKNYPDQFFVYEQEIRIDPVDRNEGWKIQEGSRYMYFSKAEANRHGLFYTLTSLLIFPKSS